MKILFAVSRFPYPLEKGDKLRSYEQIKSLSKHHEVHLFVLSLRPVSAEQIAAVEPFVKSITVHRIFWWNLLWSGIINLIGNSKLPLQVEIFYSKSIQRSYDKYVERIIPNRVFCQMVRTALLAKKYVVFHRTLDYMDCLSMGMQRRSEHSKNPLKKWLYGREANRLKKFEAECFKDFNAHCIISQNDLKNLELPGKEVIKIIGNGVHASRFEQKSNTQTKYDLVFVGNMNYAPNVDAAECLAREIMPLVWKRQPNATLLLAGASPADRVKALASSKIKVSGWLPNIAEAYHSARLFVAPMKLGSGLQNKVLEAMAARLPVVISPIANAAIFAQHQQEALIAKSAIEFADAILLLLENESLQKKLSENAYQLLTQRFDWNAINTQLEELMNTTQHEHN